MSPKSIYLAGLLLTALVLFYRGRMRTDVTALLVMVALMIPLFPAEGGGLDAVLDPAEAVSGFGTPALMMVASMFVLSAAMVRTGAAQMVGRRVLAAGSKTQLSFQLTIVGLITLFSAVINDTTTVLIWMPMILGICRERGHAPSRILLLLAYASLLGGQWTLIGTRSNLIVSDYLRLRTGEGLGFFSFTPVALVIWILSLLYVATLGRRLLPHRSEEESTAERYEINEYLTEVLVDPGAEVIGRTLDESDLAGRHAVRLLQVFRNHEHLPPEPWLRIEPGDVLVVQGSVSRITRLLAQPGFDVREELRVGEKTLRSLDLHMVECLIVPGSPLEGQSLNAIDFSQRYQGLSVLAIRRHGQALVGSPTVQPLRAGDALLLVGHEKEIARLRRNPDFFLLESRTLPITRKAPAFLAIGLLAFVATASASGLLSPAVAIPAAALGAILLRLVSIREAYRSVDWHALVVVGALIPYGLALEKTGTAALVGDSVAHALSGLGPYAIFAAILLITVALTQLIENAAVAVILAPIAYELARATGSEPVPFLLGVAICTSSAFMSPVAHESTILVMEPGSYEFRDYLRAGAPLALITWIVTFLMVPLLYPF